MSGDDQERSARYRAGLAVRNAVLGEDHVDRARRDVTALDADFQTFITEGAWGSVWARPGLTRARTLDRHARPSRRARP